MAALARGMAFDPDTRNVEQLRHDIDSGRTGDKVPAGDPAAAPLGADDEAAGTPVSRGRLAREQAQLEGRPVPPRGARERLFLAVLGAGVLVAVLVLVVMAV